jgi:hypothetical protein
VVASGENSLAQVDALGGYVDLWGNGDITVAPQDGAVSLEALIAAGDAFLVG